MEAHRYWLLVYGSISDWEHERGERQERLYIPGVGVIAYRDQDNIDFFSRDSEIIAESKNVVSGGPLPDTISRYLGKVELPEYVVLDVVNKWESLDRARTELDLSLKTLRDLL